jgi:hypothetical protein
MWSNTPLLICFVTLALNRNPETSSTGPHPQPLSQFREKGVTAVDSLEAVAVEVNSPQVSTMHTTLSLAQLDSLLHIVALFPTYALSQLPAPIPVLTNPSRCV